MNHILFYGGDATPFDIPVFDQASQYKLCNKFDSCSAPICPLDKDIHKRRYNKSESVCLWVRESVKPHGEQKLKGVISKELLFLVSTHTQADFDGITHYKKQLVRYERTPSKIF